VGGTGAAEPASLGWYLPAGWRLTSRIALHRELAADRAVAGSAGRGVPGPAIRWHRRWSS